MFNEILYDYKTHIVSCQTKILPFHCPLLFEFVYGIGGKKIPSHARYDCRKGFLNSICDGY